MGGHGVRVAHGADEAHRIMGPWCPWKGAQHRHPQPTTHRGGGRRGHRPSVSGDRSFVIGGGVVWAKKPRSYMYILINICYVGGWGLSPIGKSFRVVSCRAVPCVCACARACVRTAGCPGDISAKSSAALFPFLCFLFIFVFISVT